MKHEESKIQRNCVRWFRMQFPKLAKLLFAVPNGGTRTPTEGAILKAEGTLAGVADLILLYPANGFHGMAIEMKTLSGRQQPSQREWQLAIEGYGYLYVICRSVEDFQRTITNYFGTTQRPLFRTLAKDM